MTDMRRCLVLLTAALLAGGTVRAQSPEEAAANLEKALRAAGTLQARFEQLHYSMSVSAPLRERGDLYFQRPDRMRWEYRDPQDKVFLFKDGVFEMYIPEDKTLTRSRVSPETYESDILGILLGMRSFAEAYVIENNPFPTDAERVRQIRLTPREEGEFSHILLEIDERTWLLRRAVFIEWAGNKREFIFSQVRTNVRLSPRIFELKVPPDCEIIDDGEPLRR